MIELLEHYFNVLIQCVGAIYFGLGIVLLFGKVPLVAEYLPYRKAKRCLATAYFIMGLNLVVYLGSAELIHSHRLRGVDIPPHCDNNDENSPDFG